MVDSTLKKVNELMIKQKNIKKLPDATTLKTLLKETRLKATKNEYNICIECCSSVLEITNKKPYKMLCKLCGKKFSSTISSIIYILLSEKMSSFDKKNSLNESLMHSLPLQFILEQANSINQEIFHFHKNELKLTYIKGLKSNKIGFIKKAPSVKTDLKN